MPLPLYHVCRPWIMIAFAVAMQVFAGGCRPQEDDPSSETPQQNRPQEPNQTLVADGPIAGEKSIPRFAKNSPFAGEYKLATRPEGKRLWARSFLWEQAPEFVVERWLTPEPDMQGKYILLEYWATWCGPCRRSIPLLNDIHRRFKDRLVVIGVSDEPEETVRAMKDPRIEYHVAIDTQVRMKTALGVTGIPHVTILEPQGYVVWEGFPLLAGHELTPETVERILKADSRSQPTRESQRVRIAE